jgi:hypothetical protein
MAASNPPGPAPTITALIVWFEDSWFSMGNDALLGVVSRLNFYLTLSLTQLRLLYEE